MASLIDHGFGFGGKIRDRRQNDTPGGSVAVSDAAPGLPSAIPHYTLIEPRKFQHGRQATSDWRRI
jgi:hypothetical protein